MICKLQEAPKSSPCVEADPLDFPDLTDMTGLLERLKIREHSGVVQFAS